LEFPSKRYYFDLQAKGAIKSFSIVLSKMPLELPYPQQSLHSITDPIPVIVPFTMLSISVVKSSA